MADAVTDTHALIWYLEDSPRLSNVAFGIKYQFFSQWIVFYFHTLLCGDELEGDDASIIADNLGRSPFVCFC